MKIAVSHSFRTLPQSRSAPAPSRKEPLVRLNEIMHTAARFRFFYKPSPVEKVPRNEADEVLAFCTK